MDQNRHFKHRATLPAIISFLIAALALLAYGISNYRAQTTLPYGSSQSTVGIGLDQRQTAVRLERLQQNGVSFVYLQATTGKRKFDRSYLTFRKKLKGSRLAYGTRVKVDSRQSARSQVKYLEEKAGSQLGSLPVLLDAGSSDPSAADLTCLAQMSRLLLKQRRTVMVRADNKYAKLFPKGCEFLSTDRKTPSQLKYCFWQYSTKGQVSGMTGLKWPVTMYAYMGTSQQYEQKYGRLTQ